MRVFLQFCFLKIIRQIHRKEEKPHWAESVGCWGTHHGLRPGSVVASEADLEQTGSRGGVGWALAADLTQAGDVHGQQCPRALWLSRMRYRGARHGTWCTEDVTPRCNDAIVTPGVKLFVLLNMCLIILSHTLSHSS